MLTEVLEKVARRESLSHREMADAIGIVVAEECPPPQVAALLMALRVKGEAAGELSGAASALRARALRPPIAETPLLDVVGTGGDGSGSLNLSTAAALIAAAAGITVAKHGNRSVSSRCGSADLLERVGVEIEAPMEETARRFADTNFCFLFAPLYHPAMKAVAPVRRGMRVRTLFNMLGPLTNPVGVKRQLVGVYHPAKCELMARALVPSGVERAMVVSAACGLDEIAPEGKTHVAELRFGEILSYEVTPADFGLTERPLESIRGGDPDTNARLLRAVLAGEDVPARTGVLLNAAAALYVAGAARDLREGAGLAMSVIDSGRALAKLDDIAAPMRRAA
ncbi:MAG: anthranilate phosphoribosyltransferase [Rhodospirillaceae bacterium]|nr:anthranilate phosphoribosyltransferase [Rhodospirillaceae bacterium]